MSKTNYLNKLHESRHRGGFFVFHGGPFSRRFILFKNFTSFGNLPTKNKLELFLAINMQGVVVMKGKVLLIVFLSLCSGLFAQQRIESFTREDEKFISELAKLFDDVRKGLGKEFIEKEFKPIWLNANPYSLKQQQIIFESLDMMLKNKSKVYPEFESYIIALINFPKSGKTEEDFLQWSTILAKIITDKKNKKYLPEFLDTSAGLFESRCIYKSTALRWVSSTNAYKFVYDSVPCVQFEQLNLKCYDKNDSTVIYDSKGTFFFTSDRFVGKMGKVTWARSGLDPAKTYAQFGAYQIKTKGSSYSIDSVMFYNEFFDQPLLGQLTEKIVAGKDAESASYPKFESYYKRLKIQNVVKGVDYDGGFTMAGTRLAGTGTDEEPALLTFYRESKPFLVASGLEFEIKPDRISTLHTAILIHIEKDTISHPDVSLSFDKKTRMLVLLRSEEGISKAPFANTYHNVDMYFESLQWNIDDPMIKMGAMPGGSQHYAAFESNNFFKKKRYETMMAAASNHPLQQVKAYATSIKSDEFYAIDIARFHRISEEQWHLLLIDLNNKGFLDYNLNTHYVKVRPKLYWYVDNNVGKRDYDVIQFSSEVKNGHNAQLSLLNYDLSLKGVENFVLSDSQQVSISPDKGELVIKKDRDFTFGGRVFAGNFEFMGSEYAFSYEKFQLDMLKVDSCRIYFDDPDAKPDEYGRKPKVRVKSVLRDVAGNVKVDAPTNKSGYHSKKYPQYPIFECTKTSYVNWQNPLIQGGVYKKDNFYYQVKPFIIDSLDNFKKEDLKFEGTLVSGGIFPDIDEPLVLMDDNSLGFMKSTGSAGLAAYNGKAKVTADLKLDHSGLKGGGDFNYLTASASSDEFTFLPDSMLGKTKSFINREQTSKVEIPKAQCDTTNLAFFAKRDQLDVSSITKNIDFFEKEATLKGTLHLRPKGMRGTGDMMFSGATLSSKDFEYTRRKILADTSNFQLAGTAETVDGALAFKTNNVNAAVDFDKRLGNFKSNGGETKIDFPSNQYICYMDQFTWFMDKDEMDLSSSRAKGDDLVIDTSDEMKRSNFYSVAPEQDSLNFLATKAKYDLKKSIITCQKIDYIIVADSKVTPDSGKVVIHKYADMRPLVKAQILSNYVTQYHKIFNANLKIEGRKKYSGEGDYTYFDENKREQVIHLSSIRVDSTFQTKAEGKISKDQQFFLSPAFEYYGDFAMAASNKNLRFDGGVRMLHNCESIERTYFKFNAEINPEDIYIPVDSSLRDMEMTKLGIGVMVSNGSPLSIYPTFLSDMVEHKDQALIAAEGFLYYEKATSRYLVGSKEKIKQSKLPGNLVYLNTKDCELVGDGRVDFNVDYGMAKMANVGDVKYKTISSELMIQSSTLIDFPMEESAIKRMSEQIEKWPNLTPVDVSKTKYEKALVEIMGTEKSDKLISELNLSGQIKRLPDELENTLFLADVKWVWNSTDETFNSVGPIGIANMEKKQLFRYVKGKIEIEKKRSADVLRVYLELDPGTWYFFEYRLGIMNIISSDKDFNTILTELKDDKRRFEEGNKKYSFQLINNRKKRDDFVSKFPDLN